MWKAFEKLEHIIQLLFIISVSGCVVLMYIENLSATIPLHLMVTYVQMVSICLGGIGAIFLISKIFIYFKGAKMNYVLGERVQHLETIMQESQYPNINYAVNIRLNVLIDHISCAFGNKELDNYLQNHLHGTISNLIEEQVRSRVDFEKQEMVLKYEQKKVELMGRSLTISAIAERQERLDKLNETIRQREEEIRKVRFQNTEEYTMLFFSLAKSSVEDVEKVLEVTKLFLESGHVLADKDFRIALNKNIRNAELKQWASNIVKYNQKENLDTDNFLMNVFGEWFTGKKENISKNYSVLPKDSLISKEGVKADLECLRAKVNNVTQQSEE